MQQNNSKADSHIVNTLWPTKLTLSGKMHEARDIRQMGNLRARLSITTHNTGTAAQMLTSYCNRLSIKWIHLHSAHLVKNIGQTTV